MFGEDPEDEKGCPSRSRVCYLIGIYPVLTAMNAILDVENKLSYPFYPPIKEPEKADNEEAQARGIANHFFNSNDTLISNPIDKNDLRPEARLLLTSSRHIT
jgi:hypothetical protein